jgi:hypothetical protein
LNAFRLDVAFSLKLFVFDAKIPQWARASSFTRFLDHTQRRIIVGRAPLDLRLVRSRGLYLTIHKYNRQTSMPPVGFEPRSEQRNGRRLTPQTARSLGPAVLHSKGKGKAIPLQALTGPESVGG